MSNFKDTNSSCPDGYRALNTSELQELLQDEDKMDQIIRLNEKQHCGCGQPQLGQYPPESQFKDLQVDREMLLSSNRSVAEDSLAWRPRLNNGKLQLAEKYRELSNLTTACWEKHSKLEAHVQKHSLQTAQNLLQEEVGRAEEHSEELLEKFMEGNLSLEHFLDSFQSSRKAYHIRRAQVEKVQELNSQQAKRQQCKVKKAEEQQDNNKVQETKKDTEPQQEPPQRPNGFITQGPLRVFQLRYGLTPAILLPLSPPASAPSHQRSTPGSDSQPGQTHILSPSNPLPGHGHGQPVGLRVIGQLSGGWPANGRPVRLQQLYRPNPQQPEPPYR